MLSVLVNADIKSSSAYFYNPHQMSYVFKSNMIETMNQFNSDRVNLQPKKINVYIHHGYGIMSNVLSKSTIDESLLQ